MFRCHGQSCGDQIQLQITCPQRWCRSPMPARACEREHTRTPAPCVTGSLQKVETIKPTLTGCCHRYQSGFCPCMGSCAWSIQRCGIKPDLPSDPNGSTHIHRTVNHRRTGSQLSRLLQSPAAVGARWCQRNQGSPHRLRESARNTAWLPAPPIPRSTTHVCPAQTRSEPGVRQLT